MHSEKLWGGFCWHWLAVILSPSWACFSFWGHCDCNLTHAGRWEWILVCKQQTWKRKQLTKMWYHIWGFQMQQVHFSCCHIHKPYPCVYTRDLPVHLCVHSLTHLCFGDKVEVWVKSFLRPLKWQTSDMTRLCSTAACITCFRPVYLVTGWWHLPEIPSARSCCWSCRGSVNEVLLDHWQSWLATETQMKLEQPSGNKPQT